MSQERASVPSLSIDIDFDRCCIVLRVEGDLVASTAPRLRRWFGRIGELQGSPLVVLDLGAMVTCDSDGFESMVQGAYRIRHRGGRVIAAGGRAVEAQLLAPGGLRSALDVRESVASAVAELCKSP